MTDTNGNWTLVDNGSSSPMTAPEQFDILAGTFNFGNVGSAPNLTSTTVNGAPQDHRVGNTAGVRATFNMVNGTLTTSARFNTALVSGSTGVVSQVGGTFNMGSQFQGANGATSNSMSIVNLSGGTMNIGGTTPASYQSPFYVASRDMGVLNLIGGAALQLWKLGRFTKCQWQCPGNNGYRQSQQRCSDGQPRRYRRGQFTARPPFPRRQSVGDV